MCSVVPQTRRISLRKVQGPETPKMLHLCALLEHNYDSHPFA